mmetsp:Transcript_37384/g.84691  ORF Transcript_37384/g.84691 Transcript_37384/m.84691 type:complete len:221 (-) Transcript_37384:589-1251(-)
MLSTKIGARRSDEVWHGALVERALYIHRGPIIAQRQAALRCRKTQIPEDFQALTQRQVGSTVWQQRRPFMPPSSRFRRGAKRLFTELQEESELWRTRHANKVCAARSGCTRPAVQLTGVPIVARIISDLWRCHVVEGRDCPRTDDGPRHKQLVEECHTFGLYFCQEPQTLEKTIDHHITRAHDKEIACNKPMLAGRQLSEMLFARIHLRVLLRQQCVNAA